ncbi:hypothetical protein [Vitis varicosavirus]|uniref:Uncharacterized protein n=1 Tax=Vitis varicosavirus TaxID=2812030 RepID=A0A830ZL87_9RHAB|nr:hypothetical protein QK885_sRNA2gp5 [Vitis varicosavirus]BCS90313.1 hypothetical protein [Vitis varicosavirus]
MNSRGFFSDNGWHHWLGRIAVALRTLASIVDATAEVLNDPTDGQHTNASLGVAKKHLRCLNIALDLEPPPAVLEKPCRLAETLHAKERTWSRGLVGTFLNHSVHSTILKGFYVQSIADMVIRIESSFPQARGTRSGSPPYTPREMNIISKLQSQVDRYIYVGGMRPNRCERRCEHDTEILCLKQCSWDAKHTRQSWWVCSDLSMIEITLLQSTVNEAFAIMGEIAGCHHDIVKKNHPLGSLALENAVLIRHQIGRLWNGANPDDIRGELCLLLSVMILVPMTRKSHLGQGNPHHLLMSI